MELPMNVVIAVVVTVVVLLIIAVFALYVREYGSKALECLFNIGKYIECLIRRTADPNYNCGEIC